jgi:23S rRNA-/tRNA-specific pseudouridylate synthase
MRVVHSQMDNHGSKSTWCADISNDNELRKRRRPGPQQTRESTIVQLVQGDKTFDTWLCIAKPYPYTFHANAKRRWIGRTVLNIYETEFGAYPKSYFETAIVQGRILVSAKKVDPSYAVKDGDVLSHTIHRHEPSVAVSSCDGIDIIAETDDLVIVDKPGTLPVHPCGAYSQNSLLGLLEPKYGKLYNVNRLDRLTSGLVMIAKSSNVANQMGMCIKRRESCQKIYLARVKGRFPLNCDRHLELEDRDGMLPQCGEWLNATSEPIQSNKVIPVNEMMERHAIGYWITEENGRPHHHVTLEHIFESQQSIENRILALDPFPSDAKVPQAGSSLWFHLACPVRIADPKHGICDAGAFHDLDDISYQSTVKPAQTAFAVVRYDEETNSTILFCRPITGRSHQIRLHLQFVGHPIANDSEYGGDRWFADKDGEIACQDAKAQLSTWDQDTPTLDTHATEFEVEELVKCQQQAGEVNSDFIRLTCFLCSRRGGAGRSMLEFLVRCRGIWLHAFQYTLVNLAGEKICHQTKVPKWCYQ